MLTNRNNAKADLPDPSGGRDDQQAVGSHESSVESLLSVMLRRRRVMLGVLLIVLAAGILVYRFSHSLYSATCNIQVASDSNTSYTSVANDELPLISDLRSLTRGNSIDTHLEILQSADLLADAFQKLDPSERLAGFPNVQTLSDVVTVAAKPNTNLIAITVLAREPRAAADYANSIANTYFARKQSMNQQSTRQARELLGQRLQKARGDYEQTMTALATYQEKTGLVNADEQYGKEAENLTALQLEVVHAQAQASADQRSLASLQAMLSHTTDTVVTNTEISDNPRYTLAMQHLQELNVERAQLLQEYQPQAAEVREINARISEEEARMQQLNAKVVTNESRGRNGVHDNLFQQYATTQANVDADTVRWHALAASAAAQEKLLQRYPAQTKMLTELQMTAHLLQDNINDLAHQYQTLLISESTSGPGGRLVTAAMPPTLPALSLPSILLRCLVLGVILAVLAALVSEAVDHRVADRAMAERVAGIACICAIPDAPALVLPMRDGKAVNEHVLEHFRVLHHRLALGEYDYARLLAITSAGPGEGKTLCAMYLAIAIAQQGKRVLLVDGNLRHPALQGTKQTPPSIGLAQVVTEDASLEKAIVPSGHAGVDVLPTGTVTAHPAQVYAALKKQDTFRKGAQAYDAIIIDGPSCVFLSDIQVLATQVDSLLLVVDEKHTTHEALREAGTLLRQSGSGVTGIIMNHSSSRERL